MTLFETIRAFRADQGRRAKLRWGEPIATPGRRVWAWASLLLADHGVVRPIYWNFAEVTPALWRGPQPNPLHLERLARRGLKTVVNLRGPSGFGSYALEREACGRLGLAFEDAVLWSRSAPRPEQIGALDALYGRIAYPALVHCKSGADRAGLAAALYLLLREDAPLDRAVDQLSLRFGHVKAAKTGVLDAFFDAYRTARDATGVGFRTWLAENYDPLAVERDFHSTAWGDVLVDRILRRE